MTTKKTLENKLKKFNNLEKELKKLEKQVTANQLAFAKKISYPKNNSPWTLSNLERTIDLMRRAIISNEQKEKEMYSWLTEDVRKEVIKEFKDNFNVDNYKQIKEFIENLRKERQKELEIKNKVDITKGLPKGTHNLDYEKFKDEDDARDYFIGNGSEFFDCGQGYLQTEAVTFCYINDVFFSVDLQAEVIGQKVDVGDKLYFVDSITKIEFSPMSEEEYLQNVKKEKAKLLKQKEQELEKLKKELESEE